MLTRPSCPHCGNSPRYGFALHVERCHKRPVEPPVSALEVAAAIDATAEVLPDVPKGHCQKCGKHVPRGLYIHQKNCKGAS